MKVSHECPIDLLEYSREFNDYDYSLLHLMNIPEYRRFYKSQAKHRTQYLDNSAYEYQFLDESFDKDHFLEVIRDINPKYVIIPDVLGDMEKTIENFKEFPIFELPEDTKLIGVVQGKTFEELEKCFDYLNPRCDLVALPFHSEAYVSAFSEFEKDKANSLGRINLFRKLRKKNKIREKSIHLIGMSLISELLSYDEKDKLYIESIDTANPIQFALLGEEYPEDLYEVKNKPKYVMDRDNIKKITRDVSLVFRNIKKFKKII